MTAHRNPAAAPTGHPLREATIQHGAARYRQASRETMSARDTEIAAFRTVIRALENTESEDSRIRAIGRNHELWSTLVKDLAMEGNSLAAPLKTQLVALGLWSMRYSTLAILQKLPIDPLIEVNRNILEGLTMQTEQAAAAAPSSVQTAL